MTTTAPGTGQSHQRKLVRALDLLTAVGPPLGPEEFRLESLDVRRRARPWTLAENVQGLGVAERITQGKKLPELALKVYVERKLPRAWIDNPVPPEVAVPGVDGPLPTDVEEIGRVELESYTGRYRPAMPGCGCGHPEVSVGTFGCLVRKRGQPQELYILSNSHVLANHGLAAAGDGVLQNGVADGGALPADLIAQVAEWVPFEFTEEGFPNQVDAAIARVLDPAAVTAQAPLLGLPQGVSSFVRRGMTVRKVGRTSGITQGEVKDTNYRLPIHYKRPGGGSGRVGMRDQVLCTRYTSPGDSGAAVLSSSGKIVGLHFAGSSSTSIFNRIAHVLAALDLEVVTADG